MLRASRSLHRLQRGDTIIEVMIALAILGFAIGLSYVTANRSILAAEQAQESSTASELLQGQIEAIRSLAPNMSSTTLPSTNVYQPSSALFCVDLFSDPTAALSTYNKVVAATATTCTTVKTIYTIQDVYIPTSSPQDPDTFKAKVTWADVTGDGTTDSATFYYRVHQ
jgi:prepilin-type N-terminal cleavage/methylation domain-containing protein